MHSLGINVNTYKTRIDGGCSIEEALTIKVRKSKKDGWIDHNGVSYKSCKEMCQAYGVNDVTFHNRIADGWSICDALTTPIKHKKFVDHNGNTYDSLEDMCKHWGITTKLYQSRKAYGWELNEILTRENSKTQNNASTDHNGKKFKNINEMCKYWGI